MSHITHHSTPPPAVPTVCVMPVRPRHGRVKLTVPFSFPHYAAYNKTTKIPNGKTQKIKLQIKSWLGSLRRKPSSIWWKKSECFRKG